ncbi:hypothetical protein Trydic_g19639 [Trypoxylus dichotomus]
MYQQKPLISYFGASFHPHRKSYETQLLQLESLELNDASKSEDAFPSPKEVIVQFSASGMQYGFSYNSDISASLNEKRKKNWKPTPPPCTESLAAAEDSDINVGGVNEKG